MPYKSNEELPEKIKNNMPIEAQNIFREIWNNAYDRYEDEEVSFRVAYAGLKGSGWEQKDDKWVEYKKKKSKLTEKQRTPPKQAQENAKKVLRWKEEHGDEVDAMTQTGWTRARQLADGGALSEDVISRMAQFNRHRKNSKIDEKHKGEPWKDNGYVAWLGWGGDAGVDWAIRTMDRINKSHFLKREDKKRYTLGVVYEPNSIDSQGDFAEAEDIQEAAWRFMNKLQGESKLTKRKLNIVDSIVKAVNSDEEIRLDVTELVDNIEKGAGLNDMHVNTPWDERLGTIVESYITPVDFEIKTPYGKQEIKKGTWLLGVIWNKDYFEKIESGERTGYSMEGSGKRIEVNSDT